MECDRFNGLVCALGGLLLLCAFSLANAQQPKPPTLCIDGSSDCNLLVSQGASGGASLTGAQPFFTENFEDYPVGEFTGMDDKWQQNRTRGKIEIVDTVPDGIPGAANYIRGKSSRATITRNGDATHRAELALVWTPYTQLFMTEHPGGHMSYPTPIWYGSSVCISELDYIDGSPAAPVEGHVHQWHQYNAIVGTQPPGTLTATESEIHHWSAHDPGQSKSDPLGPQPAAFTCRNLVVRKLFDSRTNAQGGNGETTVWVNNCSSPEYHFDGANAVPFEDLTEHRLSIPFWKLGHYKPNYNWFGVDGAFNDIQHDNLAIFTDPETTCADVLSAVNAL